MKRERVRSWVATVKTFRTFAFNLPVVIFSFKTDASRLVDTAARGWRNFAIPFACVKSHLKRLVIFCLQVINSSRTSARSASPSKNRATQIGKETTIGLQTAVSSVVTHVNRGPISNETARQTQLIFSSLPCFEQNRRCFSRPCTPVQQ